MRLVENNKYLGAYYDLITTGGAIVECHSTIGHGMSPAVSDLNGRQTENLMNRLETVFQMDLGNLPRGRWCCFLAGLGIESSSRCMSGAWLVSVGGASSSRPDLHCTSAKMCDVGG